jgi:CMP-N,N'-diacetyllegionaminic acid synthase
MTKKKLLVVIPARGGSKRLKKKNIQLFCGEPLISWTIKLALKIPNVTDVIVSTDNIEIKKIAIEYGASVPFDRPKYLAKDNVSAVEVAKHVIYKLKYDGNIILLQPTSPLRSMHDIQKGIEFLKNNNAVISVYKFPHNSNLLTYSKAGERFIPISKNKDIYIPNGAIFIAKSDWLKNNNSFYTKEVATYEMPYERSIDIDYYHQFLTAENIFTETAKK